MKTSIFYLLLVCFAISNVYPQSWINQESNLSGDLWDVYFINSDTGFAVGLYGRIIKTTDGGDHWEIKSSGVTEKLLSVCFPDSATGFAISESRLLKTTDCGESWFVQETVTDTHLGKIHFVGTDTGFVMGTDKMLITTDKGTSWIRKEHALMGYVTCFWATDSKNLLVGGGDLLIVKSTDGGETWIVSHDYDPPGGGVGEWGGMFFTGKTVGYVAGGASAHGMSNGLVFKTTTMGDNWMGSLVSDEEPYYFNSIFFINDKTGFVVGNKGRIYKTNNAGGSWTRSWVNEQEDLTSVFFTDSLTGYVVGKHGTILKTTNGGLSIPTDPIRIPAVNFYPNPVDEILHIELNHPRIQNSEIAIYTLTGCLVSKYSVSGNSVTLHLADLRSGIYIARIQNKDQTLSFKFQKQ